MPPSWRAPEIESTQLPPRLRQAIRFIENYYRDPIDLTTIAHAVGLSPSYLSFLFKKECRVGLHDYLLMCRIEQAKTLLADARLSSKEIAAAVGFRSQSYFTKAFHRLTGMTPREFRRRIDLSS